MPEGPWGLPRFTTTGPISRATAEDLKRVWRNCPREGRPKEVCVTIKKVSIEILANQDVFPDCDSLIDINGGKCGNVARTVKQNLGYVTILETIGGDHVWLEYEDRHYDAEVPSGVSDPFQLPFFQRIPPARILEHSREHAMRMNVKVPETTEEMIVEVED